MSTPFRTTWSRRVTALLMAVGFVVCGLLAPALHHHGGGSVLQSLPGGSGGIGGFVRVVVAGSHQTAPQPAPASHRAPSPSKSMVENCLLCEWQAVRYTATPLFVLTFAPLFLFLLAASASLLRASLCARLTPRRSPRAPPLRLLATLAAASVS